MNAKLKFVPVAAAGFALSTGIALADDPSTDSSTTPTTPSVTTVTTPSGNTHTRPAHAGRPANAGSRGATAPGRVCKVQFPNRQADADRDGKTDYAECVTAAAKARKAAAAARRAAEREGRSSGAADAAARNTARKTAKMACKALSKKHVKGEKGTAYSRCVVAAAQMHKQS